MQRLLLFFLAMALQLNLHAQGFEVLFPLDSIDARIRDIRLVNGNRVELDFKTCYSGPGLDGCLDGKVLYYIKADSLGASDHYANTHFNGDFDQLLVKDSIWLQFGHEMGCAGRKLLRPDLIDINGYGITYPFWYDYPFISASYNALYLNDTVFAYQGQEACLEDSPPLSGNDTLIYYWLDVFSGERHYLDTLVLPFALESPGSLLHDSSTAQNIIFYDSLKIYITRGKGVPDSIVVDSTIWGSQYSWETFSNQERHYRHFTYKKGPFRNLAYYTDTLGYYYAWDRLDWFNRSSRVGLPKIADFPNLDDISVFLADWDPDSNLTYGFSRRGETGQRIELYRLEDGQVVKQLRYVAPPDKVYKYTAVSSDAEGNFYLAGNLQKMGNRSYWYPDARAWGDYNVFLIKLDKNGSSRPLSSAQRLSVQSNGDFLLYKVDHPTQLIRYALFDLSGKVLRSGEGQSGDQVSIANLKQGVYYFQAYALTGQYLGLQAFYKFEE